MKILLLIPIAACLFFASSCRTALPIDPNTMKPSTRCLPENMYPHHGDETIHATK